MKLLYAFLVFIMLALYATYPTRSVQVRNAVTTWQIIKAEIFQEKTG